MFLQVGHLSSSVLYGSTQTAVVLAELAAEAGDDVSLCDDISQKSVLSENPTSNIVLWKDENVGTHVKGFCLTTSAMEVTKIFCFLITLKNTQNLFINLFVYVK